MTAFILLSLKTVSGQSDSISLKFGEEINKNVPLLLQKYEEPGLTVALVENCQIAWVRNYGKADVKTATLISSETIFQTGSISKTLTAWGVMKLVEKGKINLDDPIEKHLKRWKLPESQFDKSEVTIRRLLNHTAGISLSSISGVDLGNKLPTLLDELIGNGPSNETIRIISRPGEKFVYSGGGYTILQLLIEDVTGKNFADFMRKEVLKPLKMNNTTFGWSRKIEKNVAIPYKIKGLEPHSHRLYSSVAGAGMYSTATDMATFLTAQCTIPGKEWENSVISENLFQEMIKKSDVSPAYGFGYEVYPPLNNIAIIGNSGSNLGWKSNFMMLPAKGLGIVVLTNVDEGKTRLEVLKAFRNLVIQKYK